MPILDLLYILDDHPFRVLGIIRPNEFFHQRPSTHIHIHHVWIKIEKGERVDEPPQEGERLQAQDKHIEAHKTAFDKPVFEEGGEAGPAGSTSLSGPLVERCIPIVGKVSTHRHFKWRTVTDKSLAPSSQYASELSSVFSQLTRTFCRTRLTSRPRAVDSSTRLPTSALIFLRRSPRFSRQSSSTCTRVTTTLASSSTRSATPGPLRTVVTTTAPTRQ